MKESYRPGYVSVKWGYCRVEPLVALYKAVFFNFPDLSVFVPGLQVGLQVRCISHHSYSNGSLDLTDLFILLWNRKRGKHCWSQPTADYFKQYTDNDVNGFFFNPKFKFSSSISQPCFIHFLHSVEHKRRILYKERDPYNSSYILLLCSTEESYMGLEWHDGEEAGIKRGHTWQM